jgi:Zn-dependent protease with chaperone function
MDERAVRAVVAHEVAHARLQHTTGGANLHEFMMAADNLFHHADPETTISGRIARFLLNSLINWTSAEYFALSRQNEFAADLEAARSVGREEVARARVLARATGGQLSELVFKPLEREIVGAIRAPTPPFRRILDRLDAIRSPDGIAAGLTVPIPDEEDANATHPPFRAFLKSLGFPEIPAIDVPVTSAATSLLAPAELERLVTRFDGEWVRRADALVAIH